MAAEEEVACGGGAVARIFVGGLTDGVAATDLETVFGSVGRVSGVDLVRTGGRNFAYVDFHYPSDKALAKLLSTYNGCKWKGGKLRLEKAKEHYLARLQREWADDTAAQAVPANDDGKKQEEKWRPEKSALENTKINIYFPKLRKVKALPFKGTGKHKYSFRHIEVPSYPIHFCDCQEHCGPPETADEEYASVLSAAAYEKEQNIMNSVMNRLFSKENEHFDSLEMIGHHVDIDITEPSDAKNDLQIEETEQPPEEDLDDLVINIGGGQSEDSILQFKREKQLVNKNTQLRKRKQFEEASPKKKRQKSVAVPESTKKKQSTLAMSNRRTVGKSLPSVSETIQNQETSPGLTGKRTDEFSSVLPRDKNTADPQEVEALTTSTKSASVLNLHATESKKGSSWIQKSAWRNLVGDIRSTSFSISQILPTTNPAPPKLPSAAGTSALHDKSERKITSGKEASNSLDAPTQTLHEQRLPSSRRMPSGGIAVGTTGGDAGERKENNKLEQAWVVPKITIGEVCPFMRNAESEKQWSKAKKVLSGFIKKSSKETTESNVRKGKPSSRR